MSARDDIRADVERWPEGLRVEWQEVVATNNFHEWAKYSAAEVELRAWLHFRGSIAREPAVLNKHWLTPQAPQPTGKGWPESAVYIGRPPSTAPALTARGGEVWRFSHLLNNKYPKDLYPDALERFRLDLRAAMVADKVKPHPVVDAIRSLGPEAALVCSCVASPWTPEIVVPPGDRLPKTVCCHGHLLVMAWRSLRAPKSAGIANTRHPEPSTAPA